MPDLSGLMASILAANIKALRHKTSPNQTEFGELFGVSQGTVARWENGAQPKPTHLLQLAELAGVNPQLFMTQVLSDTASAPKSAVVVGGLVYLPVRLPSEQSLTVMFEQLLEVIAGGQERPLEPRVAARRLAQLLPTALAQTAAHQPTDLDPGAASPGDDTVNVRAPA